MAKQRTKTVTPRLRFPEFQNAETWTETKLGVIAESESSSLALNKVSVEQEGFPLFGADGLVGRISFFEQSDRYIGIVKDGSGVGRLTLFPAQSSVLGTLAYVKPAPETSISVEWLFHCMSSLNLKKYVKGSGIPHIYFSDYSNETVGVPATDEQHKVADCLTSLDEVIAAQGRKVETLKAHKRGLMQQLFPREGETRPRLRFPEFRSSPEWEVARVCDLFDTSSGGTPDRKTMEYWGSGVPWVTTSLVNFNVITSAEEFISEAGLKNSSAKVFPKGTVVVAMYGQGKTRGQVAVLGVDAATNQACAAILPSDDIEPEFVFFSLSGRYDELRSLSNSGGQENLSQRLIRELPFRYPKDKHEQATIIGCFASLDKQISAENKQLTALKTHKQGLMQQLFPAPDALGV